MKISLAASGGGHVRQLLDLEPVWKDADYFFVTEDTALGRSLAQDHPVYFVPHFAVGQARIGKPLKMLAGALANLARSIEIVWKERPDVVISSGAGAVFMVGLLARLLGARYIVIESFARFDRPSKFARIASRFATEMVVQSAPLTAFFPRAKLFDPLKLLESARPAKEPLLFATVGATLPFERLTDSILTLKQHGSLPEKVILQTGSDHRTLPEVEGVERVESLSFDTVRSILQRADIVVCHGGTGSIITALKAGCKVIAMPRRFDLREHYDDHQQEITSVFKARGLIDTASDEADLARAIAHSSERTPIMATTDPSALIEWLRTLLNLTADARSAGRGG